MIASEELSTEVSSSHLQTAIQKFYPEFYRKFFRGVLISSPPANLLPLSALPRVNEICVNLLHHMIKECKSLAQNNIISGSTVLTMLRTFPFIFPGSQGCRILGIWNLEFSHIDSLKTETSAFQHWEKTEKNMFFPLQTALPGDLWWPKLHSPIPITFMAKNFLQATLEFFLDDISQTFSRLYQSVSPVTDLKFIAQKHFFPSISEEALGLFLQIRNLAFLLPTKKMEQTLQFNRKPPLYSEGHFTLENDSDGYYQRQYFRKPEFWKQRLYAFISDPTVPFREQMKESCPITFSRSAPSYQQSIESVSTITAASLAVADRDHHRHYGSYVRGSFVDLHHNITSFALFQLKKNNTLIYVPESVMIAFTDERIPVVSPYIDLLTSQSYLNQWIRDSLLLSAFFTKVVSLDILKWTLIMRG